MRSGTPTPNRKRTPNLCDVAHALDRRTRYLTPDRLRVCVNPECPEHYAWRPVCRRCDRPTVPLSPEAPPCAA